MILFISGSTHGDSIPERNSHELKPDIMLTYWELTPLGRPDLYTQKRVQAHLAKRRKKSHAKSRSRKS
jgi:hypothetical protein